MVAEGQRIEVIRPEEHDDLVALLLDDHRATRTLMRRAFRLAREVGPAPGLTSLAAQMQRFFRYTNPLHEVDEEQSIAPALSKYAPQDEGRRVLDQIVLEHQRLDELRTRAGRLWDELAADPRSIASIGDELRRATKELVRTLSAHAVWEERAFFPRVRQHVPPSVQAALLKVMRERRAMPGHGS